jgi:outer membrane protein insertion porin family/translocation and assembly module TamA
VRGPSFLLSLLLALVATVAVPAAAQDLSCDRGDREVRTLQFRGNTEFTYEALAATVTITPSTLPGVPLLGERRCLDPVEFARDIQRVETLYRRRGFPDVVVDTTVRTVRSNVIDVTFVIEEGRPLRVTSFALRGVDTIAEVQQAVRTFPLRVGGVFDRGALEAGRDSLLRQLRNAGWPQAEALLAYTTDTEARTAAVEVTVVPGVRARIGRIAIVVDTTEGEARIAVSTVRRTLALRTGDWYSARAIIDAQRNLYQTDAFRRVDLFPDSIQPAGDSIVNLTVRLVEGDRFAARGGIGWATLDCFRFQGTLTDRDFLPYAQRLELNARLSKIGIGEPLNGAPELCQQQARRDPYSTTLNYYASVTVRQPVRARQSRIPTLTVFSSTLSEYRAFLRRTPIGGVVSLTNPVQSRVPSTLAYQLELGRTEAEPAFFCAVFNACDQDARTFLQRNTRLAAIDYSVTRQSLDNPIQPRRGTTLRLDLRHASTYIGSDETQQFNRAIGDASWYFAVGSASTLIAHVRGGVVFGAGRIPSSITFIPPQERLYAGGPTTVRGFRQNELGPAVYIVDGYTEVLEDGATYFRADSGSVPERVVPTGGNSLVVGNLELQLPSPVAPGLLKLAVFADAGRLWNRAQGNTQRLEDDGPTVKVTPGVGVRIRSPFGAIRVDLGYNPYRLPTGAAYFNAPLQAGLAPLYCVSPGNKLRVQQSLVAETPPAIQESGACPATFRPERGAGFLRRLNPSIWIGQAF